MRPFVWLAFALSGSASLGAELLWLRSASLGLGATAETAAAVLACYFAGLGLGSILGRVTPAQPIRRYALLEFGAAAGIVWSGLVFALLGSDAARRLLEAGDPIAGPVVLAVAMLPATTCLGATLPTLGQALAPPGQLGHRGGLLYALNLIGACVGAAALGFGLPVAIGVRASYLVTASASVVAGTLALVAGDRNTVVPRAKSAATPVLPVAHLRAVAAAAGALGLGLELLWIRLFAQVLHNSVYSFAAVTLVFLLALGAGSTVAALCLRRWPARTVAHGALVVAAAAAVAGLWLFVRLTAGLRYVGMRTGLVEYVARIIGLVAASAAPGAAASGAVLPALWAMWGERSGAARPMGDLTAANTFGGVAGAVAAGFIVLPLLGLRGGFLVAAVAFTLLAELCAPTHGRGRWLGRLVVVGAVLCDPLRAPLTHLARGESLRATLEGPNGIVTVVDTGDDLQLRLDNFYVLGGTAAATNERRQGLLPLLLHPHPTRVAFIGLATGITASAGPALGVQSTTVVEVVPEVADAAGDWFGNWNHLVDRDDVEVVIDDGRHYLAGVNEPYDVIVSDLFIPWHADTGNLYSREMFETVARRLRPGGFFCQWLPLYQLTHDEFDVIARTFAAVFPSVTLWRDDFYPNRPVFALVGARERYVVDLDGMRARMAKLPEWSRDPLLATSQGLVMLYVGDLSAASGLLTEAPFDTDDRPVIEFLAPRLTRVTAEGDKDWFTGERLRAFTEALAARDAVAPAVLPASSAVADARGAGAGLYRYALAQAQGDAPAAAKLEAEVRARVPDVVASGEREIPLATLTDARQALDTLRASQERIQHELDAISRRVSELSAARGDQR